jgi:hypothetical protein
MSHTLNAKCLRLPAMSGCAQGVEHVAHSVCVWNIRIVAVVR